MSTVYVDGVLCTKETEKALLVEHENEEFWIPKSQIEEDSQVTEEGDEGTMAITQWIAERKGIL